MQNKVAGKRNLNAAKKKNVGNKNANAKNAGMKRKPEKVTKENGDAGAKKMKFAGTGPLLKAGNNADESAEKSPNRAQRKRLENKERRNLSKKTMSKIVGELKSGDTASIEAIKNKIKTIKARENLSSTAKRKIRMFTNILKSAGVTIEGNEGAGKKTVTAKKPQQKKKQNQQKPPKPNKQKKEESDDDEEEEESDADEDSFNANDSKDFLSLEADEDSDEDGEEEEDDDDEEEDDDDEEDDEKPTPQKKQKQNNLNDSQTKGKTRYILFVGNLPYDVDKAQIQEHFKNVGEIQDIRVITDQKTNKGRGIAYVEVKNEDSYQKAFALHGTFIGGRKIKVEYTQGGKKKGEDAKKEIKAKNFKLQAMRKQGKFGGKSPNQKRTERRMKQGSK